MIHLIQRQGTLYELLTFLDIQQLSSLSQTNRTTQIVVERFIRMQLIKNRALERENISNLIIHLRPSIKSEVLRAYRGDPLANRTSKIVFNAMLSLVQATHKMFPKRVMLYPNVTPKQILLRSYPNTIHFLHSLSDIPRCNALYRAIEQKVVNLIPSLLHPKPRIDNDLLLINLVIHSGHTEVTQIVFDRISISERNREYAIQRAEELGNLEIAQVFQRKGRKCTIL